MSGTGGTGGTGHKVAIDLVAADHIVRTYRTTSGGLDTIRRSLASPWSSAVAEIGDRFGSVPDLLRSLAERTEAGARDLEWRIDYIRARYPEPGGHRLTVVELPGRLPEFQSVSTTDLVERLQTSDDPEQIRKALEELLVRGAGNGGVAVEVARRLKASDVDRLLTHPDLIGVVDELAVPVSLLVAYAHDVEPLEVAHLLKGDKPIDVLRIVLLLRSGDYPAKEVAKALALVAELMSDATFAWQYASMPTALAANEDVAKQWLFQFENPVIALAGTVEDPAEAFALLQTPGMTEFLLDATPTPGTGQPANEELAEANRVVANLLNLATAHLAELSDRASASNPAAAAAFEQALTDSYDILIALRDNAAGSRISGDPVREASARLTAWHFSELANGGWPLGASSGEFAKWLAVSDEAIAALVVGASVFLASVMPTIVAEFESQPAAGDVAAALPLDQLATVLSFLTYALSKSAATPQAVSEWRALIDLTWMAVMTIAPSALVPGSTPVIHILRALLRRLANDGYSFIASSGAPVEVIDITTINDVLAELFFTIDGFGGSNNIEDVRPLQIALFASLLGYHLDDIEGADGLGDFVIEGNLVPPPIDAPEYPRFLEVFAEATTQESDLARHYISLWHLITEWATKGVRDVEIHGP